MAIGNWTDGPPLPLIPTVWYRERIRDLDNFQVLERAKDFVRSAYRLTARLPARETYGLRGQIERAAVSIAANISEGLGRGTQGDLERFLRIACGSAAEARVLIDLAIDLYSLDEAATDQTKSDLDAVRRMLTSFVGVVHRNRH